MERQSLAFRPASATRPPVVGGHLSQGDGAENLRARGGARDVAFLALGDRRGSIAEQTRVSAVSPSSVTRATGPRHRPRWTRWRAAHARHVRPALSGAARERHSASRFSRSDSSRRGGVRQSLRCWRKRWRRPRLPHHGTPQERRKPHKRGAFSQSRRADSNR